MTALAIASPSTATVRPGPPRSLGPRALIAVVLAGQAMASLDTAIVNVTAPDMQRDLHLSGAAVQLVVYAYLLSYATGLITAARLGARRGFGKVFTTGVALFAASSLACGLAATPAMQVVARTVQGAGAALLVAQVLSLLQTALEGEQRRRALALYGMVLAAGVAAGQVLGGVLVSADLFGTGWRPIFLVNVPVGVGVLLLAAGRLPTGPRTDVGRLDLAGAWLLAAAMLALLIPVSFGADSGWPAWCWPALAAGTLLLAWFTGHVRHLARKGRTPLIEPSLFGRNGVRAPLCGIFTLMGCYGGVLFATAIYLQSALHDSALRSGLTFAAYAAGFATASLTWTGLPVTVHGRVPAAGFALITAATATLAVASRGAWPW
jgi:MFS family permease